MGVLPPSTNADCVPTEGQRLEDDIMSGVRTEIAILAPTSFTIGGTRSTVAQYKLDRRWRNAPRHTVRDSVRCKNHAVGGY